MAEDAWGRLWGPRLRGAWLRGARHPLLAACLDTAFATQGAVYEGGGMLSAAFEVFGPAPDCDQEHQAKAKEAPGGQSNVIFRFPFQ